MVDATQSKTGVLLVNLGTPDAPTPKAVRRYLSEFLSDPRVVEIPAIFWKIVLQGVILNIRPRKSAHAYKQVWMEGGSPLAVYTQAQAEALAVRLPQVDLAYAMRYGKPAIAATIHQLMERGCDRILIAPLYPQYCGATTATVVDAVNKALGKMRAQPSLRFLPPYATSPSYIHALKASIEAHLAALDYTPERLLLSFHGMPIRTRRKGDPYYAQCMATSTALAAAMPEQQFLTCFQSRFGPETWLGPATSDTLEELPKQGVRKIAVLSPGFSADCLETLEEIGLRGKEEFMEAGGEAFSLIPCLNASPPGLDMLEALLRNELQGWV